MWDEFKKVYWDKTNGTHTVRLARLLKELKQMYPDATKSLAEFATNSLPAEGGGCKGGGGVCVVPVDDGDSKMETDD